MYAKKFLIILCCLFAFIFLSWCIAVEKDINKANKIWNTIINGDSENIIFKNFADCNITNEGKRVKLWDKVVIEYLVMLPGWKVVDTSNFNLAKFYNIYNPNRNYNPLIFIVGSWEVIKWLDEAVSNMKVCETKIVKIPPSKAYGEYDNKKIILVSKKVFEKSGIKPKIWQSYNFWWYIWVIKGFSGDNLLVDLNSPLAGKELIFYVKVLDVKNIND